MRRRGDRRRGGESRPARGSKGRACPADRLPAHGPLREVGRRCRRRLHSRAGRALGRPKGSRPVGLAFAAVRASQERGALALTRGGSSTRQKHRDAADSNPDTRDESMRAIGTFAAGAGLAGTSPAAKDIRNFSLYVFLLAAPFAFEVLLVVGRKGFAPRVPADATAPGFLHGTDGSLSPTVPSRGGAKVGAVCLSARLAGGSP
jgi:hypothetical protein